MQLEISTDIGRTYDLLKGSGPLEAFFKKSDTTRTRFYTDKQTFIKETAFLNSEGFTCYAGIQPRCEGLTRSGSNADVKALHRLYMDIDPARPDGTNSTVDEKSEALQVARKVQADFVSQGYEKPVIADSGNGFWLILSIPEIPIDDSNRPMIQAKLKAWGQGIIDRYSNDAVKIDSVYDLKRITKVFGTKIFNKPETEGRPQRQSGFVDDHEPIEDEKLREDVLNIPVEVAPETARRPAEGKTPHNLNRLFERCYLLRFLKGKSESGVNLTHSVRLALSTFSLAFDDLNNDLAFMKMMIQGCPDFSEQKTRYYLEHNTEKAVPYGCDKLRAIVADHFKDFEVEKCSCNLPATRDPETGKERTPSPIRFAGFMPEDLEEVWQQLERSENSFQDYLKFQEFSKDYLSQVPKDAAEAFLNSKKEEAGLKAGTVKDLLKNADVEAKAKKPTQAEILIKLADAAEFFEDPNETAYATFPINGHRETWPIRSGSFRKWLGHLFYKEQGKPAGGQAFSDALNLIEARARYQGTQKEVYGRVAFLDDTVFIDLCNSNWEVAEITKAGYRVLPESPVKFRRPRGMEAMPHPVNGSLKAIKGFLNVKTESDFALIGGWMVGAYSGGPYPIILLQGEQGTGKSVISRMLKATVDPATSPLRSVPRNPQDLMIAGKNGWVIAFDNISGMQFWLSDALCRLSTGGGFSTRELYTNDGEALFNNMRPIILNGISDVASRHDLIDRAVMIDLEMIPENSRRPESEIWAEFKRIKPQIFGGLLEAVSSALRNQGRVSFERLPRMADFALWTAAAEKETPWTETISFMDAYSGNRAAAVEMAVEADPVSNSIMRLLILEEGRWQGTATELLDRLTELIPEQSRKLKSWPKYPNHLSGKIKRAATFLRTLGVKVVFPDVTKKKREFIISTYESEEKQPEKVHNIQKRFTTNESCEPCCEPDKPSKIHNISGKGSQGSQGSQHLHTNSKMPFSQKIDGDLEDPNPEIVVVEI